MNATSALENRAVTMPVLPQNATPTDLTFFLKNLFLAIHPLHSNERENNQTFQTELSLFEAQSLQRKISSIKKVVLSDIEEGLFKGDLKQFIDVLSRIDEEDRMIQFAAKIKDLKVRNVALISIGTKLVSAQKFGNVKKLMRMIRPGVARDEFIEKTIGALLQFAKESNDSDIRTSIFKDVIEYRYASKQFDEINRLIESIPDRKIQIEALACFLKIHDSQSEY